MAGNIKDILQTKITLPPLKPCLVSRRCVLERLEESIDATGMVPRLILVSAAAGYGKSTLVREWITTYNKPYAWCSLDYNDNEIKHFMTYLIFSLKKVQSNIGKETMQMLRSYGMFHETPTGNEELLTPLLNDILNMDGPIYLILDDYHLIDDSRIHEAMTFIISNLPPNLNLVVISRTEPPWPLHQLRSKRQLLEIRQLDLKFSRDETAVFLKQRIGKSLNNDELNDLYQKTEGWVTALELVAGSLSFTPDAGGYIRSLNGDHEQIFHFLTREVFARQAKPVQEFLLQTSFLPRFCPSLCDYVTKRVDSREMINHLSRENLFIIPLDDRSKWYRYHHLFAGILYYYLETWSKDMISGLHERAGRWFLAECEQGEAVRHFIKAGNYDEAAFVIDGQLDSLWENEGMNLLQEWIDVMPEKLLKKYPRLMVCHALINLLMGKIEKARRCLEATGDMAEAANGPEYNGLLAAVRASCNIFDGNLSAGLKNAAEALRLLPDSAYFWRISASILYGDAEIFSGNLAGAYEKFMDAYKWSRNLGNSLITVSAAMNILKALWMRGELLEARRFAEEMLHLGKEEGFSAMPRMGVVWLFLGEMLREEGSLEEAERCAIRGISMCKPEKMLSGISYIFQVMILFSRQEYDEALEFLGNLESMERESTLPEVVINLFLAWKARILIEKKDYMAARDFLNRANMESVDTIYFPGSVQLVLSRLLLEEKQMERASRAIDYIQNTVQYSKSRRLMINTLILKAQMEEMLGHNKAAGECLTQALKIGKGSGFYQVFLDEGKQIAPVMFRLVEGSDKAGSLDGKSETVEYLREICARMRQDIPLKNENDTRKQDCDYQELVEDLTAREEEMLTLIGQGLSNDDISQKMHISIHTVKWHNSNIFGKLGVKNRTQAVARARQLDILH